MKTRKREVSQDNEKLEGRYANCFKIGHNAFEFVFDFGQCYHEHGDEQFHTRIVTAPRYAKELLNTLQKSIEQFEEQFGGVNEQ